MKQQIKIEGFNRTLLELKQNVRRKVNRMLGRFNRTLLELKRKKDNNSQ